MFVSRMNQNNVLSTANLEQEIPENCLQLVDKVKMSDGYFDVDPGYKIFYRRAEPPENNYARATVVFLHGQSFTSSTWLDVKTLKIFAALGYYCVAIDLPGCGKSGQRSIEEKEKPAVFSGVLAALDTDRVMVVACSMAGQYVLPLITDPRLICLVAIALSNTNELEEDKCRSIRTPVLVIHGERDTSLGPSAANNLKHLANARFMKVSRAGHACYLGNPLDFHTYVYNFLDIVLKYPAK
uniref:AB hydrolase-1 domain-containing protein n=1 Tax=Steinernema glaseri TaxID=37863 RepID=A0A1I7YEG1_9BILA